MSLGFTFVEVGVCPVVTCVPQPTGRNTPCLPLSFASSSCRVSVCFPFDGTFYVLFKSVFCLNLIHSMFVRDSLSCALYQVIVSMGSHTRHIGSSGL